MKRISKSWMIPVLVGGVLGLGAGCGPKAGSTPDKAKTYPAVVLDLGAVAQPLATPAPGAGWSKAVPAQAAEMTALGDTLKKYNGVVLLFEAPAGGAKQEHALLSLIQELSPGTRVLARGNATLGAIMREKGELPFRRSWELTGTTDILGRPYIIPIPKEHPLNTDWLEHPERLQGAQALVIVHDLPTDMDLDRLLRKRSERDCSAMAADLAPFGAAADALLAPVKAKVDRALAERFALRVKPLVDRLLQEVGPADEKNLDRFSTAAERAKVRCQGAYHGYLKALADCLVGPGCNRLAVLDLASGPSIAMPDDADAVIPPECPVDGDSKVVPVHEEARAAALDVASAIPEAWTQELVKMARYQGLLSLEPSLCAAVRGQDADAAAKAMGQVLSEYPGLPGPSLAQGWALAEGRVRIAGQGPAVALARLAAADTAFRAWADRLQKARKSGVVCTARDTGVVGVLVVEVGSSAVTYSQIFRPEDILCLHGGASEAP